MRIAQFIQQSCFQANKLGICTIIIHDNARTDTWKKSQIGAFHIKRV